MFYPCSWIASEEENGGEAPDTTLITSEDEEAVPGCTASCGVQESRKGFKFYSKAVTIDRVLIAYSVANITNAIFVYLYRPQTTAVLAVQTIKNI